MNPTGRHCYLLRASWSPEDLVGCRWDCFLCCSSWDSCPLATCATHDPWAVAAGEQAEHYSLVLLFWPSETTRTHGPLYSSSIRPRQQDSLLYTQFFRTHPSFISSSIHSIHCGTHSSFYLNISMCDLVLKDLLRRI
jgi:hypothetical protein